MIQDSSPDHEQTDNTQLLCFKSEFWRSTHKLVLGFDPTYLVRRIVLDIRRSGRLVKTNLCIYPNSSIPSTFFVPKLLKASPTRFLNKKEHHGCLEG